MNKKYNNLFKPFKDRQLTLPNRIVMAPMTRSFSPNNIPNEAVAHYYRRRAAGGTGLIITEGAYISPTAGGDDFSDPQRVPNLYEKRTFAGWSKVVNAVHQAGGKIFPQLWHVGSARRRGAYPALQSPNYGPSAIAHPLNPTEIPLALSTQQIKAIINDYVSCAINAKHLGFDGVEIHGAHGYLVDQFLWARTNQRNDHYGGNSIAKRARFAIEVVKAIRCALGNDFPLCFRFSQWKIGDYQARLADTPQVLESLILPLASAGVDIFHCSTRDFTQPEFTGSKLNLAGWVKKISGKTTISVGSIGVHTDFITSYLGEDKANQQWMMKNDLDELEYRIGRGEFDLAAVGRALIADPNWPLKIKSNDLMSIINYEKTMLTTLV